MLHFKTKKKEKEGKKGKKRRKKILLSLEQDVTREERCISNPKKKNEKRKLRKKNHPPICLSLLSSAHPNHRMSQRGLVALAYQLSCVCCQSYFSRHPSLLHRQSWSDKRHRDQRSQGQGAKGTSQLIVRLERISVRTSGRDHDL